jgi:hypothetical protein
LQGWSGPVWPACNELTGRTPVSAAVTFNPLQVLHALINIKAGRTEPVRAPVRKRIRARPFESIATEFSLQPSTVRAQCPDRKGSDRKCRLSLRHTQLATHTPRQPPRSGLSNVGIALARQAANGRLQVPGRQRLGDQATGHVRERSSISFTRSSWTTLGAWQAKNNPPSCAKAETGNGEDSGWGGVKAPCASSSGRLRPDLLHCCTGHDEFNA